MYDSSSCYLTLKIIVIHSYSIPSLSITVAGQFFLLHISFSYVVVLSTQKPLDSEPFSCFPLSFKIFFLTCLLYFSPALEENYFQSKIPPVLLFSLYPTSNTHTHTHFLRNVTILVFIILISLEVMFSLYEQKQIPSKE